MLNLQRGALPNSKMPDQTEASKIAEGFLNYLDARGKGDLLPKIVALLSKSGGSPASSANVFSANPVKPKQRAEIERILHSNYGIKKIQFLIDESLVGGLKVVIGSQVLDLSFKNKLEQLAI